MPKPTEFENLSPARKRVYRAIHNLYIERKASPSLSEIADTTKMLVGNVHHAVLALALRGWISRNPKQHRSIVPLVKLRKQ